MIAVKNHIGHVGVALLSWPLRLGIAHVPTRRQLLSVGRGWWVGGSLVAMAVAVGSGCGQEGDARPSCLADANLNCAPLYAPEFPEIFRRTLSTSCATSGVSCHGPGGVKGALVLDNEQGAYDALTGANGARVRLVPGDAKCSEIMVRLDSHGHEWSMPPDAPLDERARCAIRQWIAAGSPREGRGAP